MYQLKVPDLDDDILDNYFEEFRKDKPRSRRRNPKNSSKSTKLHTSKYDSDPDTDLEDVSHNANGQGRRAMSTQDVYEAACKKYDVRSCSTLLDQLDNGDKVLSLRHKSLGPRDVRAITVALVKDTSVEELNLSNNVMTHEGLKDIQILLTKNQSIRKLNISHNPCGLEGAISLGEMIHHNDILRDICASGCEFLERDAFYIVDALQHNLTLRTLDLSHNHLTEEGGILLGHAIAKTESLQHLNLSWNHLRMRGAKAVAYGLERNDSLLSLDLSWNGFTDEGTEALSDALKINTSLLSLDITCNRIGPRGARYLADVLQTNTTLQTLKISYNPTTSEGAIAMMTAITKNPDSALVLLEIKGATVTPEIWVHTHEIQKTKPEFELQYGSIVPSPDPIGERVIDGVRERTDPFTILMLYIENEGLRVWDMFSRIDKNGDMRLSEEEVHAGFKMLGVPVAGSDLKDLVKKLDKNNDGDIDFTELLSSTMQFRVKERLTKIKQKRQRSIEKQIKETAKSQLVNMDICSLKPASPSTRPVSPGPRSLSPRPLTPKLLSASNKTRNILNLKPDQQVPSTIRHEKPLMNPAEPAGNSSGVSIVIG